MTRSRTVALATAAFVGTATAAHAGPCTSLIAEAEQSIGRLASGPASGPTATQSLRAQLHHQPTPQSVERAASTAHADAEAALDRFALDSVWLHWWHLIGMKPLVRVRAARYLGPPGAK